MRERPNDIPSSITSSIIQLWASPLVDQGPLHVALETVSIVPAKKERVSAIVAQKPSPQASALKRVKKSVKRKKNSSSKR
jgi:hypothetical protein